AGCQACVIDDNIDAAKGQHCLLKGYPNALLVGDVHLYGNCTSGPGMLVEISGKFLGTSQIDIGGYNVGSILCSTPTDCGSNTTCCSRDQQHAARELALWWGQFEFVLLQRP